MHFVYCEHAPAQLVRYMDFFGINVEPTDFAIVSNTVHISFVLHCDCTWPIPSVIKNGRLILLVIAIQGNRMYCMHEAIWRRLRIQVMSSWRSLPGLLSWCLFCLTQRHSILRLDTRRFHLHHRMEYQDCRPSNYRKISNIRRTKSQKLNGSRLGLQVFL